MLGKRIVLGFGISILIFVVYKVFTFKIFDSELVFLDKLPVTNADYSIIVHRFPSSATIEGSIQVHLRQDDTGDSKLYRNYDKFNILVFSEITQDNLLTIAMKHNTSDIIDTITLALPNKYNLSLSP
jgi:hypothetical protein